MRAQKQREIAHAAEIRAEMQPWLRAVNERSFARQQFGKPEMAEFMTAGRVRVNVAAQFVVGTQFRCRIDCSKPRDETARAFCSRFPPARAWRDHDERWCSAAGVCFNTRDDV